jgi:hypothetical protein
VVDEEDEVLEALVLEPVLVGPVPAMPPVPVVESSSVQRVANKPSPPNALKERNCLRES